MEFFEVVAKRRSVRKFTADALPDDVIEKALAAAVLAPNSSNLQMWEFYWVKNSTKKSDLVKACFSQSAARTAAELVVAVSRIDTWRRNRDELVRIFRQDPLIPQSVFDYYRKDIPFRYRYGLGGVWGLVKKLWFTVRGFWGPMARHPAFRSDIFEMVTKSTALACENFMLALVAQGFDSCPMEGFDEVRLKKILGLPRDTRVTMVIAVGKADTSVPISGRVRFEQDVVVKKII